MKPSTILIIAAASSIFAVWGLLLGLRYYSEGDFSTTYSVVRVEQLDGSVSFEARCTRWYELSVTHKKSFDVTKKVSETKAREQALVHKQRLEANQCSVKRTLVVPSTEKSCK